MRTIARSIAAVAVVALASIALAGVTYAADPGGSTVGGTLSAAGHRITALSNGNVPAHVSLSAESVTLSETDFDLAPGEARSVTFSGKAVGYVSATYRIIADVTGADSGTATLRLSLAPYQPPASMTFVYGLGIGGLLLLAGIFLLLRWRPWARYALVRREG